MATTTQTTTVPPWLQAIQQQYYSQAQQTANTPYTPYTGQQVAGINPTLQAGLNATVNQAQQGSAALGAANGAVTGIANGTNSINAQTNPYADGANPYLQSMITSSNNDIADAYGRGTAAQTDSAFGRAGAFGGSAWQETVGQNEKGLANSLAQNTNNLNYTDYTNRANLTQQGIANNLQAQTSNASNQLQAANLAPGLQQAGYYGAQQLTGVGSALQQQEQAQLSSNYNNYLDARGYPAQQLGVLGGALNGTSTGSSTSTNGGSTSALAGGLGGALAGYALGSGSGNGGYGAALGGALGYFAS